MIDQKVTSAGEFAERLRAILILVDPSLGKDPKRKKRRKAKKKKQSKAPRPKPEGEIRIERILEHGYALAFDFLAEYLAFQTDVDADEAIEFIEHRRKLRKKRRAAMPPILPIVIEEEGPHA